MILPKAELTPSGRPKLLHGEVERVLLDKVCVTGSELRVCLEAQSTHTPSTPCKTTTALTVLCSSCCFLSSLLLLQVDIEFEGSGCTEGCAVESVYKVRGG